MEGLEKCDFNCPADNFTAQEVQALKPRPAPGRQLLCAHLQKKQCFWGTLVQIKPGHLFASSF